MNLKKKFSAGFKKPHFTVWMTLFFNNSRKGAMSWGKLCTNIPTKLTNPRNLEIFMSF